MKRANGMGGWPVLSPHTKRVSCPSRVFGERVGLLADIAAADLRINAKLHTTMCCS